MAGVSVTGVGLRFAPTPPAGGAAGLGIVTSMARGPEAGRKTHAPSSRAEMPIACPRIGPDRRKGVLEPLGYADLLIELGRFYQIRLTAD